MVKEVCVGTLGKEIFRRKNVAATVFGNAKRKKTRLMTEGSIWKNILLFLLPLILGNLLQQLYNTADSIIVGNFVGSNALAAVGSSGSPIFLLIGFSQGHRRGRGRRGGAVPRREEDRKEAQGGRPHLAGAGGDPWPDPDRRRHPHQPLSADGHGHPRRRCWKTP